MKGFPLAVEGFFSIPCFSHMKSLSRENMELASNPPQTLHTRGFFVAESAAFQRLTSNDMRENF